MSAPKKWLVLAVDDEARLLRVIKRTLEAAGFGVLTAADGDDALRIAAHHPAPIELLVTDMVMPGMSGQQLHARLCENRPSLPVIFISGTAPKGLPPGSIFLAKPFSSGHLVAAARAILGA